jgi:hypothetical protein
MSRARFGGSKSIVIASQRSRECATGVRSNPWGRAKEEWMASAFARRASADAVVASAFARRRASADRSAPRNDMAGPFNFIGASPLTDKNPCSRDTDCPSFAQDVVPREQEGAGNAECALHPRSRVQVAQRNAHTSIQVQRRQSGIPCAMALRLIPRSPRRANSSCHRRCRLDSASDPVGSMPPPTAWHQQRVSDHTVLPYAESAVVLRAG